MAAECSRPESPILICRRCSTHEDLDVAPKSPRLTNQRTLMSFLTIGPHHLCLYHLTSKRHTLLSVSPALRSSLLGGGTCDDVCGVDLCDKNAMARVNDDATVASVLSSLGKTCSTFLGRSSAGAPFFKGPELCTYYDGASPAGIDCSDTTNPGHEALCYCKTSLIQIEEDEHVADTPWL